MNCSPQGSPIHGIFQARIVEWVAISFSKVPKEKYKKKKTKYKCLVSTQRSKNLLTFVGIKKNAVEDVTDMWAGPSGIG